MIYVTLVNTETGSFFRLCYELDIDAVIISA